MKAGQKKKGQIQIEINISVGLETARQVTQLHRSPHLDKASCTRTSKARYFSYGAAGQVLSWIKAKSRPYSKPQCLQGTEESVSSLSAHALVLQLAQVPHRTQTLLFQPVLRTSSIFFFLFTVLFIIILLSNLHAQFGLVCAQRLRRGDPQQQEDCSMRRCSRTPVNGKVLHCYSSSGFRAQPAYLQQPGHLKHQRIPFPRSCKSLQTVSSIGAWSLRTQKSVWLPLKK